MRRTRRISLLPTLSILSHVFRSPFIPSPFPVIESTGTRLGVTWDDPWDGRITEHAFLFRTLTTRPGVAAGFRSGLTTTTIRDRSLFAFSISTRPRGRAGLSSVGTHTGDSERSYRSRPRDACHSYRYLSVI